MPEKLQTTHGPVLLRDAGIIAFAATFNGDEFISREIVVLKGPHPEAESDFEFFCEGDDGGTGHYLKALGPAGPLQNRPIGCLIDA